MIDDKNRLKLSEMMDNVIESNSIKKEIGDRLVLEKRIGIHVMKDTSFNPEFHQIKIVENKMYIV